MHGLFLLICIFSESFAAILSFAFNIEQGLLLRVCCVFTFVYSICLAVLTRNEIISNKIRDSLGISFFVVSIVMLLMFIVDLIHDNQHPEFSGMMLSFGSKALVAPFLALAWCKHNFLDSILRWIIPFTLVYTLVMFSAVIQLGENPYIQLSIGYQTLSYASAFSIGLLFYYLNNRKQSSLIGNVVALFLICVDLFILFSGGGKGAFVLVCILFVLNCYSRFRKMSLFLFLCVGLFLMVENRQFINILSRLSGGNRILTLFLSNDIQEITSGRDDIYRRAVDVIFDRNFLGRGPGSVLYDVGYYAHNMFLDILIDWGFIGFILSLWVIICVLRKYLVFRNNKNVAFLFIIFLMQFVLLMFSGSFYASFGIWFSVIAILMYGNDESRRSVIQS